MKNINKFIALVTVVALGAACTPESEPYQPGPVDKEDGKTVVYFPVSGEVVEVAPDADQNHMVTLAREGDASAALSVPIVINYNQAETFKVDATAEFAAGAATTEIAIDMTALAVGDTKKVTISVSDDFYYIYKPLAVGAISYTADVSKVSWEDVCTGTYTPCKLFSPITDVKLQVCGQDATRYRFVDLYAEGVNIFFNIVSELQEDKDGDKYYNISLPAQLTGVSHSTYGPISVRDVATWQANSSYQEYNVYYPDYGYIDIWAQYYVAAGSFGYGDDIFEANE